MASWMTFAHTLQLTGFHLLPPETMLITVVTTVTRN